eukprot:TRINITY_DN20221_c0_g1_i1.p1 TRINITY_DN20221_c0_g1~~TRINITY_DN20221_c0_g1_i1.p1  ORF type:complete len:148 (+),score=16.50 TRINITY_DN20221_c0_g1_i1:82-525(+)
MIRSEQFDWTSQKTKVVVKRLILTSTPEDLHHILSSFVCGFRLQNGLAVFDEQLSIRQSELIRRKSQGRSKIDVGVSREAVINESISSMDRRMVNPIRLAQFLTRLPNLLTQRGVALESLSPSLILYGQNQRFKVDGQTEAQLHMVR